MMKTSTKILTGILVLVFAFSALFIPAAMMKAEAATSYTVTITGNGVNIRTGAGTNYRKLANVSKGSKYDWLADGKDSSGRVWYKIQLSASSTGWVTSQYSKKNAVEAPDIIVKVTGNNVNIRTGAGTKYSKIACVARNLTFNYLSSAKDSNGTVWYKIQYSTSKTGWRPITPTRAMSLSS